MITAMPREKKKEPDSARSVYAKVPEPIAKALEAEAEQRRWSMAGLIAWILEQHVEQAKGKPKG
jgi:hypothetical protein